MMPVRPPMAPIAGLSDPTTNSASPSQRDLAAPRVMPPSAAGSARGGIIAPMPVPAANNVALQNVTGLPPRPHINFSPSIPAAMPKERVLGPSANVLDLSQLNLISRQYQGHPILLQTGAQGGGFFGTLCAVSALVCCFVSSNRLRIWNVVDGAVEVADNHSPLPPFCRPCSLPCRRTSPGRIMGRISL